MKNENSVRGKLEWEPIVYTVWHYTAKGKLMHLFIIHLSVCDRGMNQKKLWKKEIGNIARLNGIEIGGLKTSERSVYTLKVQCFPHQFMIACS